MDARELLSAVARLLSESLAKPDATYGKLEIGSGFIGPLQIKTWLQYDDIMYSSLSAMFEGTDGWSGTLTLEATKSASTSAPLLDTQS